MILNLWADSMITRSILDHSILLPLFYFITSPALINKCSLHPWSLLHQFVYSTRFILEYVVNEKLICPCHIFFIPIISPWLKYWLSSVTGELPLRTYIFVIHIWLHHQISAILKYMGPAVHQSFTISGHPVTLSDYLNFRHIADKMSVSSVFVWNPPLPWSWTFFLFII